MCAGLINLDGNGGVVIVIHVDVGVWSVCHVVDH